MTESTQEKRPTAGGDDDELVAGTSLWKDATRRLIKNKAAMLGGVIVLIMILVAVLADAISSYGTHFTQEETHLAYVTKPPGARSVPTVHKTFSDADDPERGFAAVDTNDDDQVSVQELSDALQRLEFGRFDEDGDGSLSRAEFNAASHGLVGPEGLYMSCAEAPTQACTADGDCGDKGPCRAVQDENGDGKVTRDETWKYTDIFPREEADAFAREFDKDDDRKLTKAEFPGLPEPYTHVLGSDTRGRDLLTRLLYGGRVSLAVGLLATLVSFLIGVTWGAVAGFLGGAIDNLMMRVVDVIYGLPFMFLVIMLMVVFGKEIYLLFLALGAVQWLTMSRIVRGQVISLKNREFVEAAESIGVSKAKIIFRHLIPNALGPIIVYSTLLVPAVMLQEAFLSFLGLGVQPPYASWGSLASEGREYLELYPWLILWPGLALAITLLSLNFFGDGLRDALDPQLKKD